jgi:hypothetical protein
MTFSAGNRTAVAIVFVGSIACGGDSREGVRDSAANPQVSASPAAKTPAATKKAEDCPATGEWALCGVEKRLRRSGFVATKIEGESPSRPGFSVKPTVYKLGRGRLEVFIYDDASAMNRDIDKIDTVTVTPPGSTSAWPSTPGLIRNGNLAAVYMDQSGRQAERLVMALTAGAPSGG